MQAPPLSLACYIATVGTTLSGNVRVVSLFGYPFEEAFFSLGHVVLLPSALPASESVFLSKKLLPGKLFHLRLMVMRRYDYSYELVVTGLLVSLASVGAYRKCARSHDFMVSRLLSFPGYCLEKIFNRV